MRVLILTFGTRGDVQPYVALAHAADRAGHEAAVCTAEGFRPLVEDAGVPYLHMGNDMLDLIQAGMPTMAAPPTALRLIRRMTAAMRASLLDQWEAAQTFGPDLLVYHPKMSRRAAHRRTAADPGRGVAAAAVLHPDHGLPDPVHRPLAARRRREPAQLPVQPVHRPRLRRDDQHLPPPHSGPGAVEPVERLPDLPDGRPVPVLYGFSSDRRAGPGRLPAARPRHRLLVPARPDDWQPPPELQAFLAAGEPPLYIGFGSMGFGKHAAARGATVVEAVRRVGVRAVVATGWGGIDVTRVLRRCARRRATSRTTGCSPHRRRRPPRRRRHHRRRTARRPPHPDLPRPRRPRVLGRTRLPPGRRSAPDTHPAAHRSPAAPTLVNDATYRPEAAAAGTSPACEDRVGTVSPSWSAGHGPADGPGQPYRSRLTRTQREDAVTPLHRVTDLGA